MAAAALIASAREAAGITQRQLADRSATAQSAVSFVESGERMPYTDTLERMLGAARHRLICVPSVRFDGTATAERIRAALATGRDRAALRAYLDFADALRSEEPAVRVALAVARPRTTGSPVWDAALAAIVHYCLARAALPVPTWVNERDRFLPQPSELEIGVARLAADPHIVAPEFALRNVLLEERNFASV